MQSNPTAALIVEWKFGQSNKSSRIILIDYGYKIHGAAERAGKFEGTFSDLAHMQTGSRRYPERVGLVKINSVAYSYAHPAGQGAFGKVWKVLRHSDKHVNVRLL